MAVLQEPLASVALRQRAGLRTAVELDLLDHPFYVFKNKGTGQINVVYKRNGGGVGLIEPEE